MGEITNVTGLHAALDSSDEPPVLQVLVEPGTASQEDIADVLSDLSILYRRMGGSGINFTSHDVHILILTFP